MLNKSVKYRKSCIFHSNSDHLPWLPNPLPLHQISSVPNIPALDVVTYPAASPLSAAELSPKINNPVVCLLQDQMPSLCSHSSLLSLHHCFQPHVDYFLNPVFSVPTPSWGLFSPVFVGLTLLFLSVLLLPSVLLPQFSAYFHACRALPLIPLWIPLSCLPFWWAIAGAVQHGSLQSGTDQSGCNKTFSHFVFFNPILLCT